MTGIEMDAFVAEAFPVVAASHTGAFEPASRDGTRFVVGTEGLYRELTTPWLYAILLSARMTRGHQTPYGAVEDGIRFKCTMPGIAIWADFLKQARAVLPSEAAALMVWNVGTGEWRLAMRTAQFASADRIVYTNPPLGEDEIGVIDVHTHGEAPAFFSREDDADDFGGIKLAVVLGRIHATPPELRARLVCPDRFVDLVMEDDGSFAPAGAQA